MWARTVGGTILTFHLAGIHDQNFLMRDEETGSFWQQVSGECIAGPLRGARLERVESDELTLRRLAVEVPGALVLVGDAAHARTYEREWEPAIAGAPTVVDTSDTALPPRALILGVEVGGSARAYEERALAREPVVLDELGGTPVLIWSLGGRMERAFDRRVDGAALLLAPDGEALRDADTGSAWDFRGCAVDGPLAGRCLTAIPVLWDYWFDWRAYHPTTTIYGR